MQKECCWLGCLFVCLFRWLVGCLFLFLCLFYFHYLTKDGYSDGPPVDKALVGDLE